MHSEIKMPLLKSFAIKILIFFIHNNLKSSTEYQLLFNGLIHTSKRKNKYKLQLSLNNKFNKMACNPSIKKLLRKILLNINYIKCRNSLYNN